MSLFDNASSVTLNKKAVQKLTVSGVTVWEASGIVNLLPRATDEDRVTVYDGVGYRFGSRLNSSGQVVAGYSSMGVCASGFIPAKPGDVLRVQGFSVIGSTQWYVIAYDSTNTKTGYKAMSGHPGVSESTWVSPGYFELTLDEATFGSTFDAIRFSARNLSGESIATINQEFL